MKKLAVTAAVLGSVLVGWAPAASAAREPGACTPHNEVSSPRALVAGIIDMSIYPKEIWDDIVIDITAVVDKNRDGIVCWRYRAPNPGQDRQWSKVAGRTVTDYRATVVTDNVVQAG